jgi:hypothetical protein
MARTARDHERRAGLALQRVEHGQAVHARQLEIEQQQVGAVGQVERLHAVEHVLDVVPQLLQPVAQDAPDARVVVGDDDAAHVVTQPRTAG